MAVVFFREQVFRNFIGSFDSTIDFRSVVDNRKTIEVVAAVIQAEGDILCVQRGENKRAYISLKWEFPGGKLEPGETEQAALRREIMEELRMDITVGDHLMSVHHAYPDFDLIMHAYLCSCAAQNQKVVLTEHLDFRWLAADDVDFAELDWAAADLPIVEKLVETTASAQA